MKNTKDIITIIIMTLKLCSLAAFSGYYVAEYFSVYKKQDVVIVYGKSVCSGARRSVTAPGTQAGGSRVRFPMK
jgi:hypothetical protein